MARRQATYSRLSVGAPYQGSALTLAGIDAADTGTTFSWDGGAVGDTLSVGTITGSGPVSVGGGSSLAIISSTTAAISFGAINPLGTSSTITIPLSGATRGDDIIITPDATWSQVANNLLISYFASSGSTTGEVSVWAQNSTQSAITPTASTVFRVTRIGYSTFV